MSNNSGSTEDRAVKFAWEWGFRLCRSECCDCRLCHLYDWKYTHSQVVCLKTTLLC